MMEPIVISQNRVEAIPAAIPLSRRSLQSQVVWGQRVVTVGGQAPVRVQSMTNTDPVDVIGTAIQVKELALAGSELVRLTVNTPEAAEAVPHVRDQLDKMGGLIISKRKVDAVFNLAKEHDVFVVLAVRLSGVVYVMSRGILPDFEVIRAGRRDRNDPKDIEECYLIPMLCFEVL